MRNIEKILKALANQRRLVIVRYLKEEKETTVGDIANKIKLSFKATSKHLAILYVANIVEKEQKGLQMFYRLSPHLHHLAKYISNSRE